jgi:hypothetical protein
VKRPCTAPYGTSHQLRASQDRHSRCPASPAPKLKHTSITIIRNAASGEAEGPRTRPITIRRLRALAPEGSITLRDRSANVPHRGSRGCLDVPLLPEMPGRSRRPAGRPPPRRAGLAREAYGAPSLRRGCCWAPADACWLEGSRGPGELTGPLSRCGAGGATGQKAADGVDNGRDRRLAWRQTAVRRSPPARRGSCYRAVGGCLA